MSPSSSPVVHCALRSRRRLNAQAAPHYAILAGHSTLVNLSFFIFKVKKIRASIPGTSVYIMETCTEREQP